MLWKLALQGVVALACDVAGIGVIPAALEMVGALVGIMTIVGAADPRTEAKTALKDWAINKIADRAVSAAVNAVV
jgi:hypothetical protein